MNASVNFLLNPGDQEASIQVRRATSYQWAADNPVLLEGELGVDTTTGLIRVGNGVDQWSSLVTQAQLTNAINSTSTTVGASALAVKTAYDHADTATRLPAGSNGQILSAQSSAASGFEWINNVSDGTRLLVKNVTGLSLTKGQVVYVNGGSSDFPTVAPAQANTEAASAKTAGIVLGEISNNNTGYILLSGMLKEVNTVGLTAGQALWLSPSTAGAVTNTRPSWPNYAVFIGYAPKISSSGEIFVMIQNRFNLNDLNNVSINSPVTLANNDSIIYDSSTDRWINHATDFLKAADFSYSSSTNAVATYSIPQTHKDLKIVFDKLKSSSASTMISPTLFVNSTYNIFAAQSSGQYGTTFSQIASTYGSNLYFFPGYNSVALSGSAEHATIELVIYDYSSTTSKKTAVWRHVASGASGYTMLSSGVAFINTTAAISDVGIFGPINYAAGAACKLYLMGAK